MSGCGKGLNVIKECGDSEVFSTKEEDPVKEVEGGVHKWSVLGGQWIVEEVLRKGTGGFHPTR